MQKIILPLLALTISMIALVQVAAAAQHDPLGSALAAQPPEVQARYKFRHPQETLELFGIRPGMSVVDVLPGGGWYSKILLPYLGSEGQVIGADYALELWPHLGYDSPDFLDKRKTWVKDWSATAETWRDDDSAGVSAFVLGSLPESMHGTADAVLFVRALHNMAYNEATGGYLSAALQNAFDVLKPGGIVGIVQHHARDNMPDDWANGENGYIKRDYVIEVVEAAGFELVDESDINANVRDMPTDKEYVWRLPPSYDGANTPEAKVAVDAIGESNRMTMKFRKP